MGLVICPDCGALGPTVDYLATLPTSMNLTLSSNTVPLILTCSSCDAAWHWRLIRHPDGTYDVQFVE